MSAKQMDAISSFQHVVDNIPQWRTQISEVADYAAKRYEEFVAEYSKLIHRAKARKHKPTSMASIHSEDEDLPQHNRKELSPGTLPSTEFIDINPFEAGNRFIYTQAQRKRKPGTSIRSGASGPRVYRSKQMVVIYYDSHIQIELDKLVKAFGCARNNLRKGKNAYNADKGFALPTLSRRYDNLDNLVPNVISRSHPRLPKAASETSVAITSNDATVEAAFTRTDKEIEQIQSLCETAAHQAIRDGDCKVELAEAISKLDVLSAMAASTSGLLKAEKQTKDQEEARAGEGAGVSDAKFTQSTLCENPSVDAFTKSHKLLPPVIESFGAFKRPPLPITVSAPNGPLSTDAIEVDDNDDDSSVEVDLNMTTYRAGRGRLAT